MDEEEILNYYMTEVKNYPLLSEEETLYLLEQYKKTKSQEYLNKLVEHNLRLSVSIAQEFKGKCTNMTLLDLIQENNISLMRAIEKFDLDKKVKLVTYAGAAMRKNLQRTLDNEENQIRISVYRQEQTRKYYAFVINYQKEKGILPPNDMIMKELKIGKKALEKIQNLNQFQAMSLEERNAIRLTDADNVKKEENEINFFEEQTDQIILLRSLADFLDKKTYYILYHRVLADTKISRKHLAEILEVSPPSILNWLNKALMMIEPILFELQIKTIQKYGINKIDTRELIPIGPKMRLALHYLKFNLPEFPYHVIYTEICNPKKDKVSYYHDQFPTMKNIQEEIYKSKDLMKKLLTEDNINKIYQSYRGNLTVPEILALDIFPNESIKEKNFSDTPSGEEIILKSVENSKIEFIQKRSYIKVPNIVQ